MKTRRTYDKGTPPGRNRFWGLCRFLFALLVVQQISVAQDLIVNGTVTNTGTIRVKNQTLIAQPSVGGEIELKGASQTLPAKNYHHVRLSGTGTKTTVGGDLAVSGNLTIAVPVTLKISPGNILTLGDTLFDSGKLLGAIQKSVDLSGTITASDFGNIGTHISWASGAPGVTTVLRASDSLQTGNGNQSIKRFYSIQPADASAVASLSFKYSSSELNGHIGKLLKLWKSADNGATWHYAGGNVDTTNQVLSAANVILAGRWTAADTLHPLGPFSAPGVPSTLILAQGNNAVSPILTAANPMIVLVTDAYDTPMRNVSVNFAISSAPATASGHSLSVSSALTDSLGRASTILTLGNKIGTYQVTATAAGLTGSPLLFTARATPGQAATLQMAKGNEQTKPILQTLDTLFSVTAYDSGGNPVPGASVHFAISAAPAAAFGQSLSVGDAVTDSLGVASTLLRLGSKAGFYQVRAVLAGGASSLFTAHAVAGAPQTIQLAFGNRQTKPILTPLDTAFTVSVVDTGGNPIFATPVRFAFSAIPKGASGQTLSTLSALTDSSGLALTHVTLGDKVGDYVVTATKTGLHDSTISFMATATAGKAAQLLMALGNNQAKPILTSLDTAFRVTLLDVGGNAVSNTAVQFAIASIPSGATGQTLSLSSVATDSLGHAATVLTLGSKVGDYVVTASSTALQGVTVSFAAHAFTGSAAALMALAGNNQSATINTTLPVPFGVAVTDAGGNPVANEKVTCALLGAPSGATGYSLSATDITTNSAGQATSRLTLGNKVGTYTVAISAPSLGSGILAFSAQALPGAAASIVTAGGENQTAVVAEQLQRPLTVAITDVGGNAVPGVAVHFSITSAPDGASGQDLSAASVQTDAAGMAQTTVTLGTKSGLYTVTSSVTGLPAVTVTAKAQPGVAASMAAVLGNSQSKTISSTLDTAFVTFVTDLYGNAVPHAEVHFAIAAMPSGATGAVLSDTLALSDSAGSAHSTFTLGNKVGAYTIASTIQPSMLAKGKIRQEEKRRAPAPVNFTVYAKHGAPATLASLSGIGQLRPTGTQLPAPFVLTVYDAGANAIPSVPVKFTITSIPAYAAGQVLSDTLAMTDSTGTTRTFLTLGIAEGIYGVTAAVAGAPPLQFTAQAYYVIGDPNNDVEVDVADITLLTDYVTHRLQPSLIDSIKADVTHDGKIDTADVSALRRQLLSLSVFNDSSSAETIPMWSHAAKKNTLASGQLEATSLGLRFNLENSVPVRGIELHLLLTAPYTSSAPPLLFSRGQSMNAFLNAQGNELTVILYNAANIEIAPGTGSILRLPLMLDAVQRVDTSLLILSYTGNKAMKPELATTVAGTAKYPDRFALIQNYPNPFNGSTTISFEIPDVQKSSAKVLLQIYNTVGQLVRTLAEGPYESGRYSVTWDGRTDQGSASASGVYFYRLMAKDYVSVKKMVYLR